jgi:hypothetical protein
MTRSIPSWTMNVFSSTVTNDEQRIPAHTLNSLERCLSDESTLMNQLRLFYKFQAAGI